MAGGRAAGRLPLGFLFAAALLGFAARLAFGLTYWTDQPLTRDESEYLSLARSLAAGRGFVYDAALDAGPYLPFGRAPGYAAFLALVGAGGEVARSVPASVKIAQSLTGAAGVFLVGVLASRVAGAHAARAAALLAALYPPLVWTAAYALSEALFWPLGLAVALLFGRVRSRPGAALACGLVCGAAVLVRPALLLFVPLAAAWLIRHRRAAAAGALALGVALVVLPWTVRNYVHHDRFMLVASDGGVTFWTGNHPLATGEGDMAANQAIKLDNQRLRAAYPGLSEEQMEPIYYREALDWIRRHPADWVVLQARKVFYLV
jgi:4-amino-4-deoxy-L-arabinose transferase-like glycosyltransferase